MLEAIQIRMKYYGLLETTVRRDYQSGARIEEVPREVLGDTTFGLYSRGEHKIYIRNDLAGQEKQQTERHESTHAQGFRDEMLTDGVACMGGRHNVIRDTYRAN